MILAVGGLGYENGGQQAQLVPGHRINAVPDHLVRCRDHS